MTMSSVKSQTQKSTEHEECAGCGKHIQDRYMKNQIKKSHEDITIFCMGLTGYIDDKFAKHIVQVKSVH